ncbi:verticillium wilt disease resistance protein [Striga asiatica]|uniref:Verticillium wilt disease resistance protein n=1 Tax=Striga asiatica TaxID=4170 RepID=A0A5A7PYH6_STRAF|nr:verticillium wilt disease resistance protein [Striga asiatica]
MRIQLFFSCLLLIPLLHSLRLVRVSAQCLDGQLSLLVQLNNSLEYNPLFSTKLITWSQSFDCCSWDGIVCDELGHVISLDLENENISGGLDNSTALFELRYLKKLNLASNSLVGWNIPKGLQNLTDLVYLNLSNSGFGGQVPIELSKLTNLIVLDLSSLFVISEPLRLESPDLRTLVRNLTGLKELYLDAVNISTQKNDWGRALSSSLPNLTTLSLRSCDLSGPLDSDVLRMSWLSVIQLDNNNLSTSVPEFLASFSNLTVLTLSGCSLTGSLPEVIFQVPTLQVLDLSNNNMLGGTIRQLGQGSLLRTLVLTNTNLSGSLPDSVANLKMLSKIDVANCKFTGNIPPEMANLTELVYLDFSNNEFTGLIPPFRNSKNLSYVDLSRNLLTGTLSHAHFEGLSSLVYVDLGYNLLNGSIPSSLFSLPFLQKLQLSNNKFGGRVDEFSTSNATNLDTLDLSNNELTSPIPMSLFELTRLSVLSLDFNLFNGTIKLENFQRLGNLTRLELGHNNLTVDASIGSWDLTTSLPQLSRLNLASCSLSSFPGLINQSKITFLDLSNNFIEGEIPSWIWNVGNGRLSHLNLSNNLLLDFQRPFYISGSISVLDLSSNELRGELPMPPQSASYVDYSNNSFTGTIPPDIGNFSLFAIFLSVANNNLTGQIPESLCHLAYLQVLDLSGNHLDGNIPSCLIENRTTSLGVLNLSRNRINGFIPDKFSVGCSLKTLDMSSNSLEGKIPRSLSNCAYLEVINFGNNRIEDRFPCMLKNSSSLRVLVLRHNKFYGDLRCPAINGSWPNLQIIDIAFNKFSGELYPKCIASWKGMTLESGTDSNQSNENDHLRFVFLKMNRFYYQDTVTVTIKGLELELVKILKVFTAIDFSCNNFSGEIPKTIGDLTSLYVLNLSHNSLTGNIPSSVGNLSQLGSLDLSVNRLTGEIPNELAGLNFLSFVNLSYNMLVGRIPKGPQLQTFSAENFVGNAGLCGLPLKTSCGLVNDTEENRGLGLNKHGFDWQFIFTGLGFGVGASLVVAPLVFCKVWREKCEGKLDRFLKAVFPGYGVSYVRCDSKVENIEERTSDDDDDDDDDDKEEENDEDNDEFGGKYCVFCTKMDVRLKQAVHNPKCTCHCAPPIFSSSPQTQATSSSSSSLLVIYFDNC